MTYQFSIPGRLPGLNEIIGRSNHHRYAGARQKKAVTTACAVWMHVFKVPKFTRPVAIGFRWIEPNGRRDRDNVQSGAKFILDGMQTAGIIKNDSRRWVVDVKHDTTEIDKVNPRVEVTITDEI